ncbi:hypothetical protein MTO96_030912 [Rhipicephalus appendiculatus]
MNRLSGFFIFAVLFIGTMLLATAEAGAAPKIARDLERSVDVVWSRSEPAAKDQERSVDVVWSRSESAAKDQERSVDVVWSRSESERFSPA